MTHALRPVVLCLVAASMAAMGLSCPPPPPPPAGTSVSLPGMTGSARVVTDRFGVAHIFAENDFDLVRVQGYVHARDRFWQMDTTRREASGDLAELVGVGAIGSDVQNRTIGLRRAAQRSLDALAPAERALLGAFAEGVNAWLAANPLPPEYAQLELTTARPWTAVDTLTIGRAIAASLSLDIDAGLIERLDAYVAAGQAATPPFDGRALLFADVQRAQPMDLASTVPDATGGVQWLASTATAGERRELAGTAAALRRWRARLADAKNLHVALDRRGSFTGSNEWGVTAAHSATGKPMIANDPHLSLDAPATFYENHLVVANDPVRGAMNVSGITFAGVPFVILGQNERIAWGATTNPMDVTDLFRDRIVAGNVPGCPATACIISGSELYPLKVEVASYRANTPGDGMVDNIVDGGVPLGQRFVLTVDDERRSFGPIVDIDDTGVLFGSGETHALVLQYTGFHATREVETFQRWARARTLPEFLDGLALFDAGSQNWAYADSDGHVGYFSSSELPLRKDLENGAVVGRPPFFVRDGTTGENNWVYDPARSQHQTIPFAVMPFDEMPQTLDPSNGFFVNANNDPAGTSLDNDPLNQHRPSKPGAIYYLNGGYSDGLRAGRITRLLKAKLDRGERIDAQYLRWMQGNTQQLDAELMTPHLLQAWANAAAPGAAPALAALAADPRVAEAIGRLSRWDYSAPTGIADGYDAADVDGARGPVYADEAERSVAATIYNVWRAKAIVRTIDATLARVGVSNVGGTDALVALHHLLQQQPFSGVGASGVDFFPLPAALSAPERRDLVLLESLRAALDGLASAQYAPAFAGSTHQDDYRWGRLHRITFDHRLGGALSVPPAAGFSDLAPGLPGISRDGGYEVVNASGFNARADGPNSFRFGGGPVRRYVGVAGATPFPGARVAGWNVIPGGSAGDPASPLYARQLPLWLTNDQHPVMMSEAEALRGHLGVERFSAP